MELKLAKGTVKYDKEDEEIVNSRTWHINDSGYAVWRGVDKDGKKKTIRMHRLIARTPDNLVTDHINHNRLDNRRSNLKVCTQFQNMQNRSELARGYWWHKQISKWSVEVNGQYWCVVNTEEEAKEIVEIIRQTGTYVKPERTVCKYGHSLADAYIYNGFKSCKPCAISRAKISQEKRKWHKQRQAVNSLSSE